MTNRGIADFTEGDVSKQLMVFATPLFLSNLLQIIYNMVDMVIVGQTLGKVGLTAVSVGGDVSGFLTFIAMGFSNAGQVIISQYVGMGERKRIGRFVGTMFTFLFICAVMIGVGCLFIREPILHLMNTPQEAFDEALAYATVSMVGLVFIYGYNMVSAVLRGMGDSRHPFIFISIAAILNVVLDVFFVIILHTGSMGAALATVISQGLSFLLCAVFLYRNRAAYALDVSIKDFLGIDRGMLLSLVKLGFPMAIKNASVQLSKLFVNSWINSYGVVVSAFAGVANKLASMSNLFSNSFNAAGSSMVGQNIGAKKYRRVWEIVKAVFRATFVVAVVLSIGIVFFPKQIYGIFTSDTEVVAIGMGYIPIAVVNFFGSCGRSGMNALINGSGHTKVNFATAILDGIIFRIGFALLFGLVFDMKYYGFWLGDALAGFTPFFIGLIFYKNGAWKNRKGRAVL